ncbi:hypothetical protein GA0115236_14742 [Streptomyces sp. IgraMP-1]|nr:hypothetical protein GA0115236_14742 [Streptomyces sp. IgraMP-1]
MGQDPLAGLVPQLAVDQCGETVPQVLFDGCRT